MNEPVYEPREDSFLLRDCAEEYMQKHMQKHFLKENHGFSVLDMGTGSGIQAIAASKYAEKVVAVDINGKAIDKLNEKIKSLGLRNVFAVQSDLFSGVSEKFDLIIFNPPYLPDESMDVFEGREALYGGEKGYEVIERFLEEAKNYLKGRGRILLLFSSLSNKIVVEGIMRREGYFFREIRRMKLSFESLYVYEIYLEE